jgi:acyl-CoA reductase-like NAD-dependent aldehyde dehydrogenase
MGKPIGQSKAEIEKCAGHIEYMIERAESFVEDETLTTR